MRAVQIDRLMEPGEVRVSEIAEPPVRPGEIVIEVRAAGCNFSDILLARGQYQEKPELPFVLGREAAGLVAQVGEGVSGFRPGDRVLASTHLGAFAERVAVAASRAWRMPADMSFEAGACLPIVYPTSHAALVDRAALRPGETLLVHAAAGGVGLAAVQIGRALGARVIATAGGPEKLEIARRAGAEVGIDYRREDFAQRVLELTDGAGADVIYDSVGGDTFDRSLKCIAWKGRLVVVGFASGRIPEVAANRILLKNIAVLGLHWPVYAEREPETVESIFEALFELHREGGIEPLVHARYPLEQAARALEALATRKTVGKVLLVP
jgi:NADPH2:quinone reductase